MISSFLICNFLYFLQDFGVIVIPRLICSVSYFKTGTATIIFVPKSWSFYHFFGLSFAEFCSAYGGDEIRAWNEYIIFGGLPHLCSLDGADKKSRYLKSVYETVHLKDIYERHQIENPDEFEELTKILALSIGSSINPNKIVSTFESV